MKKICLIALFLLSICTCYSQIKIDVKENITYIVPNIENMILLCNSSENTFRAIMEKYGYQEEGMSAQYISYHPNVLHYMIKAATIFNYHCTGDSVNMGISIDHESPRGSIAELYNKLRPHFVRKDGIKELFAFTYKGTSYVLSIARDDSFCITQIIRCQDYDNRLSEIIL